MDLAIGDAGAVSQEIGGQRYVNSAQVRAILGDVTEMTLWRWERELGFPRPVKLGGGGRNFWWLPTVLDWAHARAARENQQPPDPADDSTG